MNLSPHFALFAHSINLFVVEHSTLILASIF
jgi:hypothetical protein